MDRISDILLNRRTIRKYSQDPVEETLLDELLKTGCRASTTGNMQVYSIIITGDDEKKRELALKQFLADLGHSGLTPEEVSTEKPAINHIPVARYSIPDKSSAALSGREIEVLTLLAEGLSTKNLAQRLNISHFTARNHIQNILVKLELHSKAQAVSYAFKRGIL